MTGAGRQFRVVTASVLVLLAVAVAAGFPVYVTPQIDPLRPADAIVVLGGDGYERYSYALELGLQGLAPEVVMSNSAGDADVWLTDLCEHQRYTFTVSCFQPEPATTRGEAQELRRLAAGHEWHTVIVVTYRPHVSRARYILKRCFDGELVMNDSPTDLSPASWATAYAYQTAGYVRAALERGC